MVPPLKMANPCKQTLYGDFLLRVDGFGDASENRQVISYQVAYYPNGFYATFHYNLRLYFILSCE